MPKFISSCVVVLFIFAHSVHSFSQSGSLAVLSGSYLTSMVNEEPDRSNTSVKTQPVVKEPTETPKNTPESDCNIAVAVSAKEILSMQNVIIDFFNAMNKGDIKGLQVACTNKVAFKTHLQDQYGNHHIMDETLASLVPFVAQAGNCFNLEMQFELLPPDMSSMQFRTPYICLVNNVVSHCGVCTFEFEMTGNEWKIKQMVDTRSRSCK